MTRGIIISIALLLGLSTFSCALSMLIRKIYSKTKDTDKSVLPEIVGLMELDSDDLFMDLGAGDFRVVFAMARQFNVKAVGYEISPLHIINAKTKSFFSTFKKSGSLNNVSIEAKSLFLADISNVDAFYLNLDDQILHNAIKVIQANSKAAAKVFIYNNTTSNLKEFATHEIKPGVVVNEYRLSNTK